MSAVGYDRRAMPRLQRKSFDQPDQVRRFEHGRLEIVTLERRGRPLRPAGLALVEDVAPIAGTPSLPAPPRRLHDLGHPPGADGRRHELVIRPGDAYEIPPGHDAWVVGDEPWDSVEFTSAHTSRLEPGRPRRAGARDDPVQRHRRLDRDHSRGSATRMWQPAAPRAQHADPRRDRPLPRPRDRTPGDGFLALFDGAAKAVALRGVMIRPSRDLAIGARRHPHRRGRDRRRPGARRRRPRRGARRRRSPGRARCSSRARPATSSTARASRSNPRRARAQGPERRAARSSRSPAERYRSRPAPVAGPVVPRPASSAPVQSLGLGAVS